MLPEIQFFRELGTSTGVRFSKDRHAQKRHLLTPNARSLIFGKLPWSSLAVGSLFFRHCDRFALALADVAALELGQDG
jgi:hypothetical protein